MSAMGGEELGYLLDRKVDNFETGILRGLASYKGSELVD